MMRCAAAALVAFTLLAGLGACGGSDDASPAPADSGSGGSGGTGGTGTGGTGGSSGSGGSAGSGTGAVVTGVAGVPDLADHATSIDAIKAASGAPVVDVQALLTVIKGLPDVSDAGTDSPGDVWILFNDGVSLLVSTVPRLTDDEAAQLQASAPTALARPAVHALDARLPGSRTAFVNDGASRDYAGLDSRVNLLNNWLVGQAYSVAPSLDTDPSQLLHVTDASVFYMAGHGGQSKIRGRKAADARQSFWIETAVAPDSYTDGLYRADVWDGLAVWNMYRGPAGPVCCHLAITPEFVLKYMNFADGSLVFLNACEAYAKDDLAGKMIAAFITKGAKRVLGWDALTSGSLAIDTAMYMFDRLLSPDEPYTYYKDPPRNRPFAVDQIYADMQTRPRDPRGYGPQYPADWPKVTLAQSNVFLPQDPATRIASALQINKDPSKTTSYAGFGLAPSISGVNLENLADRLTLSGNFGNGPGAPGAGTRQVTIDGLPLTVQTWGPTTIVLTLPRTGASSYGKVIVSVDGARSNPATIDSWKGVRLDIYQPYDGRAGTGEGTAVEQVTCLVDLRLSTDTFRAVPGGTPRLAATVDDPIVQPDAGASNCSFDARGRADGDSTWIDYSVNGSNALPWLAPAQRADVSAVDRYAYATATLQLLSPDGSAGQSLQMSLVGRVVRDAVATVTTVKATGVSGSGTGGLHLTGAATFGHEMRFGSNADLLAGSNQQTADLFVWGSGQKQGLPADPEHAR